MKSGSSERYSEIQKDGKIKKYLITETKNISSESFSGINGIRIFINALQNEDLPQGWNNGNKVYYKDQWHYAEFDSDGVILQMNPTPNGEVLQVPSASMVKDLLPEGAEFAGWDINGDGLVDKLPVTLTEDIYAEAVYNVDIKSISLDEQITVEKGYTNKLEVKYSPAHHTVEGGVTFTSSDESIVTVDSEGILTGVKEGTADVTAVLNNNPSVTASCTVEVVTPSYGIRFDPNYGQLNAGETLQLEPELKLPEEEISAEPVITWKSEDETIATVENGLISAVAPGSVTITASCGEYTADYYLTVLAPLEEISVDPKEGSLNVGETQKLKVSYLPANTTDDKTVTWFSTRSSVATVDDEGLVTAVGSGTAKIKAAVGNKITTYEVTVKAPLKWIKLNTTTGTMRLNRTKQLEVIYEPVNTTDDKTAVWTSSDPQVASVDESGRVTAVSRGKAVIKAKVGDFTASYDVTVIGLRDENTGIIVSNSDDTEMDEDMLLYVSEIRKNNWKLFEEILRKIIAAIGEERAKLYGFTAYDISLLQSGQTVQPGTTVDVDIPAGVREDAVVYRVENDGSLTDMHVIADEEGYYSFETEHFSTYVLGIRHNWSTTPLEEKKATCTEAGWITYKCQDCDEINKIEIPALGHQEKAVAEIPATCTEPGRSAGTECSVCGEVLSGEAELPALGHEYGEWITVKEPTYTEEGTEEQVCSRDPSHRVTRSIPKLKRPLSECEIKLSDTAYVYDGGEIRPEVTVSYNGTMLTEGADYILSYENNIDPGTATVTIEAAENSGYIGTVQKNFAIRAVLDEYVTVVQPGAFKGCANLTNVNIRSTVTGIGEQAFADCKNLRNIYFYGNCPETGKDMFQNVTANAYYPYNDLTWSMDKLQDYGGNITWCPWNPQTGEPARRDLSICEMTVSAKDLTYNGKAQTPQITVTDSGKVLKEGVDYTVTYKDNVKAGTATVTATGAGIYGGSITTRFAISKASNTIKVSDITKTASSKSQTVKTTVRAYGGAKLTYSSNNKSVKVDKTGKLTIAKNFAGKAVITVKSSETSCYKAASKKFNVTVKPAAVTISKASNSAKQKITVSWKKNTTCSGYAVQYSTDKSCKKGVKTVYISKNSTVKATLSKLTKGKTYYVRIASYKKSGSTKIYSAWSKVKSVKVKK